MNFLMYAVSTSMIYPIWSGGQYTIEDGSPSNRLALAYKESFQFTEVNEQLASILDQARRGDKIYSQFATSFPWQVTVNFCLEPLMLYYMSFHLLQLLILSQCTIKKLIRNPMVSIVQVLQHIEPCHFYVIHVCM